MKRAKVRYRNAGRVDYEALGKPVEYLRWWTLRGTEGAFRNSTGKTVKVFGFSGFGTKTDGPWFGIRVERITQAPCQTCGLVGVFASDNVVHAKCGGHPACTNHAIAEVFAADEWVCDLDGCVTSHTLP